jgi:hypothetical protein
MGFIIRHSRGRAYLLEALLVFLVLAGVVVASGAKPMDLVSAFAGFLTFLCTQNAFDMNEQLRALQTEALSAQHRYRNLFFLKEAVWVLTFILLGSYPLLASTGVFASYPWWRKKLRAATAA